MQVLSIDLETGAVYELSFAEIEAWINGRPPGLDRQTLDLVVQAIISDWYALHTGRSYVRDSYGVKPLPSAVRRGFATTQKSDEGLLTPPPTDIPVPNIGDRARFGDNHEW